MIDLGVEALLIMDKAGIPLLFQKFNPKRADIEPVLLSGFLTAVKAFSSTLIDDVIKNFHINYGKRLITIITGQKIIFAAIHNSRATDRLAPVLTPLLVEFEKDYYQVESLGESGPIEKFLPFKERIASVLGFSNPSLNWIPLVVPDHDHDMIMKNVLVDYFDGHHTIEVMITKSGLSESEILKELSRLWIYGQIKFRNILTKEDFIIPTNKLALYLQSATEERKHFTTNFTNLVSVFPFLISHFDGKTTVETIMLEFNSEGIENIYWLLDYLYLNDAITILSPEKRRILMAKEILQKSLEIASRIYSRKETLNILRKVLKEINKPEIISHIRLTDVDWTIDYSNLLYEELTPEKTLEIYDFWLEILRLFIFTLTEKKRKKYIETLTEELNYDFFEKYRSEDLDGLEEFAFWLEIVFN
ncbi:MAG: hypothetical protein FK733_13705 [Asgard group archaeon]|nr:hypothetical protein [Asgard group archaeon]